MASPKNGIEVRPDLTRVQQALQKRILEIANRSAPNRQVGAFLDSWVQQNFTSEGGNVGGWTPFKYGGRIIGWKNKAPLVDPSAKLLQDTGRLRASVSAFHNADTVGIGTDVAYSIFHERPWTKAIWDGGQLPKRRILPTQEDVIEPVVKIFQNWLDKLANKPLW